MLIQGFHSRKLVMILMNVYYRGISLVMDSVHACCVGEYYELYVVTRK